MKLRILRPALEDLAGGREFYDRQSEGVGSYFFDSLFSEIDSLVLYAGIHRVRMHAPGYGRRHPPDPALRRFSFLRLGCIRP